MENTPLPQYGGLQGRIAAAREETEAIIRREREIDQAVANARRSENEARVTDLLVRHCHLLGITDEDAITEALRGAWSAFYEVVSAQLFEDPAS